MDPILGMVAGSAMDAISEIGMSHFRNDQQIRQQRRLNVEERKMMDYGMLKQLELWNATGYKAQMEQLKAAGLNPALMYKGSGAGGQTTTSGASNAAGAPNAPANAPNVLGAAQMGMQLELLKAQKENIQADTDNKKADSQLKGANTEGVGLENAFKSYMMSTSPEGKENVTIGESTRGQQERTNVQKTRTDTQFQLDENDRRALMNSKVMERIGAEISKLVQEGKNLEEIYKNLQKQGLIMDAEIEWNKLDISGGNIGKFLTNIIKMALKPR